jgi:hypothetical protein
MKYIALIIVALLLLVGGQYYYGKVYAPEEAQPISGSSTILFPKGGEQLKQGETYLLLWTGGPDTTQIFLIDRTLKDQGASVSVSDRIYGIENQHSYEYTVPTTTPPGEYEFQIGEITSAAFRIIAR